MSDRVWQYKTWSGSESTVVGADVQFTSQHVVWTDALGQIILAEKNENVNELSEIGNGGSATRGTRGSGL